ncbi:MAG TPA: S-adenosylmethionine:tRNA ribosyltransferase-isomerase, partial [Puia sp.]|nr:S-adenosylmethionine:tRNA ribosyltransferase-isomerase [Puia sp.]
IEIFCLEPPAEYGGIAAAMARQGKVRWKCLIGGASKWKPGQVLLRTIAWEEVGVAGRQDAGETAGQVAVSMQARYVDKLEDSFLIEFSWEPAHLTFAELLHQVGQIPLPPYIKRPPEASDQERYQTVYARHDGSVAAPTAGLHFTESIFQSLAAKNIQQEFVTLHVGAGTFLPVKAATMEQHIMHVEYISVTQATLRKLRDSLKGPVIAVGTTSVPDAPTPPASLEGPVIAVGTTSARTLESLYWLGVKTIRDPSVDPDDLVVGQWDAYAGNEPDSPLITPEKALSSLLDWLERQGLSQLLTRTQLLITPGYDWKIVRGLITNFHQPESTLLLLVASLIGKDWKKVYDYALGRQFRFLSYGDGSLLLR